MEKRSLKLFLTILYGGSVKANNAKDIFGQPDVDGGLVGRSQPGSSRFCSDHQQFKINKDQEVAALALFTNANRDICIKQNYSGLLKIENGFYYRWNYGDTWAKI